MATTLPHIRMQGVGTLGLSGGNEIFSMQTKHIVTAAGVGPALVPTEQEAADLSAGSVTAWTTFITAGVGLGAYFSAWVNLTEIRCTIIGTDGKKVPGTDTQVATIAGGGARGTAGVTNANAPGVGETPYQVALCATLTGNLYASGAASHGRFYLPCPNLGVDTNNAVYNHMVNGLMSVASTDAWAIHTAQFCGDLTAVTMTDGKIQRLANVSTSAAEAGVRTQNVTFVTMDSRPDTIRRRSNSIGGQNKSRFAVA